jgi:hypothetical protein
MQLLKILEIKLKFLVLHFEKDKESFKSALIENYIIPKNELSN